MRECIGNWSNLVGLYSLYLGLILPSFIKYDENHTILALSINSDVSPHGSDLKKTKLFNLREASQKMSECGFDNIYQDWLWRYQEVIHNCEKYVGNQNNVTSDHLWWAINCVEGLFLSVWYTHIYSTMNDNVSITDSITEIEMRILFHPKPWPHTTPCSDGNKIKGNYPLFARFTGNIY